MKKIYFLIGVCMALSQGVYANKSFIKHTVKSSVSPVSTEGIQNDNLYYLVSTGSSGVAANCQNGSCSLGLVPGGQQWVEIWDSSGWYDIEYDVCQGINEGACDSYIGHFGISFSTSAVLPSEGADGGDVTLTSKGNQLYGVVFTPSTPAPPPDFPTPSSYDGVEFRGVNLAGGAFESGFQLPSASDALYYVQQGMNIVRLPFLWEYVQPDLNIPIDFNAGDAKMLNELTQTLTDAGVYVILDMHNYMRRNGGIIGVDPVAPSKEQYAAAWASFATQYKDNSRVFFDLMNEPNNMETEDIIDNYNAAIAAIRAQEAMNLLLLEGNQWTCMAAWGGNNYTRTDAYGKIPCYYGTPNSALFTPENIIDSANNYAINVHEYFSDSQGCGSEGACGVTSANVVEVEMLNEFVEWLVATGQKAILTETNTPPEKDCSDALNTLLTAINQAPNRIDESGGNAGGFIGWLGWAGGSAWPSDYQFNLNPTSDGMQRVQMIYGFEPSLVAPSEE